MNTYTAHVRPGAAPVLVREGFCWGALVFGPLWLLANRLWLAAAITLLALIAVAWLPGSAALTLAVLVLIGLLGRDLRRWSLARRGFAIAHVVAARSREGAFLRLLDHRPDLLPHLTAGAP